MPTPPPPDDVERRRRRQQLLDGLREANELRARLRPRARALEKARELVLHRSTRG